MSTTTPPFLALKRHSVSAPSRFAANRCRTRRRVLFWCLLVSAVPIDAGVLYLAASLLCVPGAENSTASPLEIAIPYEENKEVWEHLRGWIVQEDGRNKPFDTFCRESVRSIVGREVLEGHDPVPVVVSWLLLSDSDPQREQQTVQRMGCDWERHPFILCNHLELRRLLEDENKHPSLSSPEGPHGRHITPASLRQSKELPRLLREVMLKKRQDEKTPLSSLERAALEVHGRLDLYDRIRGGGEEEDDRAGRHPPGDYRVVALDRASGAWFSLRSVRSFVAAPANWETALKARRRDNPDRYEDKPTQPFPATEAARFLSAYSALEDSYRSGDVSRFVDAAAAFRAVVSNLPSDTANWELWYNRVNPFRKAWLMSLSATLLLVGGLLLGGRWRGAGRLLYAGGLLTCLGSLAWAVAGFACRVHISGRPPVSNMYESLIWVAFMTAVLGMVLELIYRRGAIALAAGLVSTFGFVLADQLPLTFSPSIQPLQAVLRSNYWLLLHVLTIVSSYAAFALAWGLGNFNLALILYAPRRDLIEALSWFGYRAIQVGILLLFLGTMLGGFWAAESWGRFWGWDPKEVWSLVALLCYLIPLHARYTGWVRDFGLAVCSVVCFASVAMAWYGVNFVLGAGLHSYGFGYGDNSWVYLAGLVNISLVLHAALRYLSGQTGKGVL